MDVVNEFCQSENPCVDGSIPSQATILKPAWILALRGLNKKAAPQKRPLLLFSDAESDTCDDSLLRRGDLRLLRQCV